MSRKNIESILPLTPMQEGILFHSLLTPDSWMYFNQYSCKIRGGLEVPLFQTAWEYILARHSVLRSFVTWKNRKQPLQIVRSMVEIPWHIADWQRMPSEKQETAISEYLQIDRAKGFDLSQPPLMRLALFRTEADTYDFVWSFHHIMLDGWSMRLVLQEVFEVYEALAGGGKPALEAAPPFQAYVRWLQNRDLAAAERHWKKNLAGFTGPTPLGLSDQRNSLAVSGPKSGEKELVLPAELTETLQTYAREHRITLNALAQGAWAFLLSSYSRESDVVFGVTVSGRPFELPGVERMVGLLINTLPLRVRVDFDMPPAQWLQQIQSQMLENLAFASSPLVSIQKWSGGKPGSPLFNSILVFENHPASLDRPDAGAGLNISGVRYIEYSNYPLALLVVPEEKLRLIAVYDRAWFDEETIERLLSHFETVFGQLVAGQNASLGELSVLGEDERNQLLKRWNDTDGELSEDTCIHHLIERHARDVPERAAVAFEDRTLSYGELDRAADVLAARLLNEGLQPETFVGVYLERSPELIIAILGILKAGGAYVPIDPSYPDERVVFLLEDTKCPLVVTHSDLADRMTSQVKDRYPGKLVRVDAPDPAPQRGEAADLPVVDPGSLAYVIYTSGSTGTPKGVMVSHRNLVHSTTARFETYPDEIKAFLLLSSFSFDSSLAGIFGTLCQGGKLVLPRQRQEQDAVSLLRLIEKHQVTHCLTLPSLYSVLLELGRPGQLESLKAMIVAGEACPPDLAGRHFNMLPNTRLYNEYGPTEATVWCTVFELKQDTGSGPEPIGKPIRNTKVYILDPNGHPCPIGIAGEIFVGGKGVARGYLNQPGLTAHRFLPDPFTGDPAPDQAPGLRIYRTGDLARWRPDGEIEFLGRVDQQIKIRGYRVELGEIENALLRFPGVREAVVIARQDRPADPAGTVEGQFSSENLETIAAEAPELVSQLLDEIERLSGSEVDLLLNTD